MLLLRYIIYKNILISDYLLCFIFLMIKIIHVTTFTMTVLSLSFSWLKSSPSVSRRRVLLHLLEFSDSKGKIVPLFRPSRYFNFEKKNLYSFLTLMFRLFGLGFLTIRDVPLYPVWLTNWNPSWVLFLYRKYICPFYNRF